jgi:hypothetical protein
LSAAGPELERSGFRGALALRGIDAGSGTAVADDLAAVAYRSGDPETRFTAIRSPVSTLLGFGVLPGLGGSPGLQRAHSSGGAPLEWPAVPAPEVFVVRVSDRARRYLPTVLAVGLPAAAPVEVPLYSAPGRPAPSGLATVRGEVRVSADGSEAAWAVVSLTAGGVPYETVSDGRGRFLFYLPYPEALPPLSAVAATGLDSVTWPLELRVRYQPGALRPVAGAAPGDPPELGSIRGQAPALATLGGSGGSGGGPAAELDLTLAFGTALVLRVGVTPA